MATGFADWVRRLGSPTGVAASQVPHRVVRFWLAGHVVREPIRPSIAEVDLGAIRHNVGTLARHVGAHDVMAVVKADAYGHGAVAVANAALEGGARWLGVALVEEAEELRDAGVSAPILVLSEHATFAERGARRVVEAGIAATAYSPQWITALDAAARRAQRRALVHIKLDTGMHRVGAPPEALPALLAAVDDATHVDLGAVFTHFACADDPTNSFTAEQVRRFDAACAAAGYTGPTHLANSAGSLWHPQAWREIVRPGIAIYGVRPDPRPRMPVELRPALRLRSVVGWLSEAGAGEGVSYGHAWHAQRPTRLGILPIGYADGIPRQLGLENCDVLVGGTRCPIVGAVTMDQTSVDLTPALARGSVNRGDEVVLLGAQGDDRIDPWEWAQSVGTIAYEPIATIGKRVPRRYIGHGAD